MRRTRKKSLAQLRGKLFDDVPKDSRKKEIKAHTSKKFAKDFSRMAREDISYQDAGYGCIKFIEDFVLFKIFPIGDPLPKYVSPRELPATPHPETGRSYKDMWEEEKKILIDALRMDAHGNFVHSLIVFSWMRGEGKSFMACLIQLWKFVCFPAQQIVLGANSKEQSKFVHFDIIKDIILNSPRLFALIGEKNIQQKDIVIRNEKGDVVSAIKSISSFSGIVSNITGYTFSEIFAMKKVSFFTQLDGSTRNVPNALGVIDSTVSSKDHILYKLYDTNRKGDDPSLYFSYRSSPEANPADFWHPYMTPKQLESYKTKFPPSEFDQYFKNTWESGENTVFRRPEIDSMEYIGWGGQLGRAKTILRLMRSALKIEKNPSMAEIPEFQNVAQELTMLKPIDSVYSFISERGLPRMITLEELHQLTDLYDTDWCLGIGIDRADPMKDDLNKGARTMITATLKGLPNSRSQPIQLETKAVIEYIYFRVGVWHVRDNSLTGIKAILDEVQQELCSIESVCGERWGLWDLSEWCEENDVLLTTTTGTYDLQRTAFSEFFTLVQTGRFKSPATPIPGSESDDICREEILKFVHDSKNKFYGSPSKHSTNGVQDDSMFAQAWGIYGMKELNKDHFLERRLGDGFFGMYIDEKQNRRILEHGRR
jgi:hypothetical protein